MPRVKKQNGNEPLPANKQKGEKTCNFCHTRKKMTDFYISKSPLYSVDGRVPVCKECVINASLNEDGTVNELELNKILKKIDKPYYKDLIESSVQSFMREHSYVEEDKVQYYGKEILQKYFTLIAMRQDRDKSYDDSEKEGFIHRTSNTPKSTKERIAQKYADITENNSSSITTSTPQTKKVEEELIYSEFWMGDYSQRDIDLLDKYYAGLNRDYKIVTENHRDYAKKIAKASLMMDKAYEDMLKGVAGADKMYSSAKDIFDSLSKSAKFSEDKRSINDVGISSFSKITSIVENHNWIPQYIPKDKDMYDEMLEALSVINQSV